MRKTCSVLDDMQSNGKYCLIPFEMLIRWLLHKFHFFFCLRCEMHIRPRCVEIKIMHRACVNAENWQRVKEKFVLSEKFPRMHFRYQSKFAASTRASLLNFSQSWLLILRLNWACESQRTFFALWFDIKQTQGWLHCARAIISELVRVKTNKVEWNYATSFFGCCLTKLVRMRKKLREEAPRTAITLVSALSTIAVLANKTWKLIAAANRFIYLMKTFRVMFTGERKKASYLITARAAAAAIWINSERFIWNATKNAAQS